MPSTYLPISVDSVATPEIPTFKDLVDILLLYYPNDSTRRGTELAVRSAKAAYQECLKAHPWKFYNRRFTFTTSADSTVENVSYSSTIKAFYVGAADIPSWAQDGAIQILTGDHYGEYEIMRVGGDYVYLRPTQAIGADIADIDIRFVRRRYALPVDFLADMTVYDMQDDVQLRRLVPSEEHVQGPWERSEPDVPQGYIIRGGRSAIGKVIELTPPPSDVRTVSVSYRSTGRPLLTYQRLNRVTGSDGSASVTFDVSVPDAAIGTVLRINTASDETPGSMSSYAPWTTQRILVDVNGTSGTLDYPLEEACSDDPCVLSDIVDIDPAILWSTLEGWAMAKFGQYIRATDEAKITMRDVDRLLLRAKEADSSAVYSDFMLPAGGFIEIDYESYGSDPSWS
jgi:hypothetical protein